MSLPAWVLGVTGVAFMSVAPAASTVEPKSLRQITGSELESLIVNSAIQFGHPPVKGSNSLVFTSDHQYKFITREKGGVISKYHLESDRVVVEAYPKFYVRLFRDREDQYYISVSSQEYAGYQPVVIHHL
jgi:hypothetical protein